jgi:drug/metabolite transporter (DMT)-like permease
MPCRSTNRPTSSFFDNSVGNPRIALEIALLALLSFIWGGSFTLIKVAIDTIPPATIVGARVTVAAFLLLLVAALQGFRLLRGWRTWAAFFIQGLFQSALPFLLIAWGEEHIASGLAGVLNATPPMFVLLILLTTNHGNHQIGAQKILGIGVGVVGVVVTMGPEALHGVGTVAPVAQGAVLAASVCHALATMWGRRFNRFPPIVTAAGAMTCAAVLMLPASLLIDRPWSLAPTPKAIGAVAFLAVVCTAAAMIIYFRLLRTLGPLTTASGSYLRAGFSVGLGVLILGERFAWHTLGGMMLIIVGVMAITVQLDRPQHWIERRKQRIELRGLDADRLRDIGVTRAGALREAGKPFWQ